jgi:hypothetical protein
MDNRLNKLRKEMKLLREDMVRAEAVMHEQIARDQDSTGAAVRLLEMRARMAALIAEWTAMGGLAILPTVEQRLKEKREPLKRLRLFLVPVRKAPPQKTPPKTKKRKLAARA